MRTQTIKEIVTPPPYHGGGQNGSEDRQSECAGALKNQNASARVLIYSHDTFGLGHFRRCLKIAREIHAQSPDSSILLLTGSPLAHQFPLADGIDFVKLPAVIKTGDEEYRARSLRLSIHSLLAMRAQIIRETALAFQPDVVLIDHAPLGLRNEALPALEALRTRSSRPAMILGLRDIIDEPERIVARWEQSGMYGAIDRYYDQIAIYGQRECFDSCTEYQFPQSLLNKSRFTGYIAGGEGDGTVRIQGDEQKRSMVLVTVGGGEDGGEIIKTYMEMLRQFSTEIDFETVLLPGPLLPAETIDRIQHETKGLPVRVEHFVPELTPLLSRADLVISMAGYNTVAEILAHAKRALLIPREWPRQEQLLRAQRLASHQLLEVLRLRDLNAGTLWSSIQQSLKSDTSPLNEVRRHAPMDLRGAATVASLVLSALVPSQIRESHR